MNTITVITQLCEEDRKRIDELIGFAALLVGEAQSRSIQLHRTGESVGHPDPVGEPGVPGPVGLPVEGAAHLEPVTVVEETPAPAPEPVAEPTPEVKPVSLAEFQKAVTLAVSKGATQKQAVKKIINTYATSVSGVPEDKRAEVMEALAKL